MDVEVLAGALGPREAGRDAPSRRRRRWSRCGIGCQETQLVSRCFVIIGCDSQDSSPVVEVLAKDRSGSPAARAGVGSGNDHSAYAGHVVHGSRWAGPARHRSMCQACTSAFTTHRPLLRVGLHPPSGHERMLRLSAPSANRRGGRRGAGAVNASLRAPDIADPESMVIPHISGGAGRYRCSVSPGPRWVVSGGAGEEGGDDAHGVTVGGLAGVVVAHHGPRCGSRLTRSR